MEEVLARCFPASTTSLLLDGARVEERRGLGGEEDDRDDDE